MIKKTNTIYLSAFIRKLEILLFFIFGFSIIQAEEIVNTLKTNPDQKQTVYIYISAGTTITNQEHFSGATIKLTHKPNHKNKKKHLGTTRKTKKKKEKRTVKIVSTRQVSSKKAIYFYKHSFSNYKNLELTSAYTNNYSPSKFIFFKCHLNQICPLLGFKELNQWMMAHVDFLCFLNSSFVIRPPPVNFPQA